MNRLDRDGALCHCGAPALYLLEDTPVCQVHFRKPTPLSETLEQMRAEPYTGPFLNIHATIGMGGDGALRIAKLLRELAGHVHADSPRSTEPLVVAAIREAEELERIGHLAKSREGREAI